MLVTFEDVEFGYGENSILGGVSFAVHEGQRVGLIGANGEGKTTLLKLLMGELLPEKGNILRKNGATFGYLEQNGGYVCGNTVYGEMRAVFKAELNAVEKLSSLSAALAKALPDSADYRVLSAKLEELNKFIAAKDCYNTDVKIRTVLNGMGFADKYDRVVDDLSGGEKTRLKLARLLLEEPDLLILDEPTNHLDVSTLFWLEDYLSAFKGALLIVSHDRYFLDRTATRILELENKKLLSFNGNYTKYKSLKAELCERLEKEYEAQIEERARLQEYVDKNIVRATTASSAQSRVKKLEKLPPPEKPFIPPKPPVYDFTLDSPSAERAIEIVGLKLERGGKTLLQDVNFSVRRGERVAIIGENGVGKSSLLREITEYNPKVRFGRGTTLSFYDQENKGLSPEGEVLDEFRSRFPQLSQTEARAALARCGLFADDMQKKIKNLSGGERAKLALCIAAQTPCNTLILDEPTNHLDLPARESLEKGLAAYGGTLIFVSHDRYFIQALATSVAEIKDGRIFKFDGGYAAFNAQKKAAEEAFEREREQADRQKFQAEKRAGHRSKKERAEEENRKRDIRNIESEITALEEEENQINLKLSEPSVVCDYKKVAVLSQRLEEIKINLDALYKRYAEVL